MRQIRQVLRLARDDGASQRDIAKSLGLNRGTVSDYLVRAAAAKLMWPLPSDMDDATLEARLFPPTTVSSTRKPHPDWHYIHLQLKKKGATLKGLHEEYLEQHLDGMAYSRFCEGYRHWSKKHLKKYLRQNHVAGERTFVDYAEPTIAIHDRGSGELKRAQIFVGVLGASNFTYCEAHWSQQLPNWIAAHVRMFEYFEGSTEIIVCDNLKSAVIKASRTEPEIHPTYAAMSEHYDAMVLPAYPEEPQHKAKVENAVLIVERWILFCLRKRIFTSLEEANEAIRELLERLNDRPFQRLPGSRRSQYLAIDKPALKPLPVQRYEYTEFHKVRVGLDGFFKVDDREYSAPDALYGLEIEVRLTSATVEILHAGRRIGSHVRRFSGPPVVDPSHLSPARQHFKFWEPSIELDWAETVGPYTKAFLAMLLKNIRAKESGMRKANSMKGLKKQYGIERLDSACARAIEISATSVSSVRSILRTGLDQQKRTDSTVQEADFEHENLRGADFYS